MKTFTKPLLAFLLLPSLAAATTTVTGKMQNLGTGNVATGAFMRFWLRGCGGNQPRINGTSIIAPSQGGVFFFDFAANSSGNVSGTLYSTRDNAGTGNGEIECGGSLTAVWYGMQAFYAGKGGPEVPVHAKNGATLDISNVSAISTNPVVTSPTGDTTYARLDAGNQPFTGSLQVNGNVKPDANATRNLGDGTHGWIGFFSSTTTSGNGLFGSLNVTGNGNFAGLTASLPVCTDASKNLTSTCSALIPNSSLQNSSVTYNGQAVSLGSSGNVNSGASAHSIGLNEGAGAAIAGLLLGAHQVAVGVSSADPVAKTVPDCTDTTGNHLNYTQSSDSWSCGTSASFGTAIRVFSATGCTPASSTDSQCTGSITVSPAFADASYIPILTANGNGGSVPNILVTVNGSLSSSSIPYALTCTFSCGTVNAPTIYVIAIHP